MFVSRVSHWSGDAELDHIGQGCNIPQMQVWRQAAFDEYFRHPDPEDSCLLAVTSRTNSRPLLLNMTGWSGLVTFVRFD